MFTGAQHIFLTNPIYFYDIYFLCSILKKMSKYRYKNRLFIIIIFLIFAYYTEFKEKNSNYDTEIYFKENLQFC